MISPESARSPGHATCPDDASPSVGASLSFITAWRRQTARRLFGNPELVLAAWGGAWLLGFGACYLASSPRSALAVPGWLAYLVLGVSCATAGVVSAVETVRPGRGVVGPSRQVTTLYWWSWLLATGGLCLLMLGLGRAGLSPALLSLAWPGLAVLVSGVLYAVGGALWQDRLYYALGAWTVAVGAASTFAGAPGNLAVLALAGGGGLLVMAVVMVARRTNRWAEA
jgi:hypothetical protein